MHFSFVLMLQIHRLLLQNRISWLLKKMPHFNLLPAPRRLYAGQLPAPGKVVGWKMPHLWLIFQAVNFHG